MEGRYNTRSPAVKRLMKEAQELSEPTDQYYAQPLEDNLFEWHFTVRGPADSEFQNGIYHGRIILPVDYPMKPPSIIWLTPNGRFETNKKICLSISGHHPESWQPSWSIRTALLAIIGFMPTHGGGAIGSLDYTADERKILAKKSREWKCQNCGDVQSILLEPSSDAKTTSEEVQKLAAQINFQSEQPKNTSSDVGVKKPPSTSAQSSSSQAGKAQRSSSQLDTPVTQTTSQQSEQISNATSVSWNVPQPGVFNPWCMPPYPNMGGFPFHPSVSSHSVVSMMPRFPFPPGHHLQQRYESPFFMPGLPTLPSYPQQLPHLNPATFRLIKQAQALPGRPNTPCDSPFEEDRAGTSNTSKSEKELSNKNTKNSSSRSVTPNAAEPLTREESQRETDSSTVAQEAIGAEASPPTSPDTEIDNFRDVGAKGVRQRPVTSQISPEVTEEDRPNRENVDAASGDQVGQRHHSASLNLADQRNQGGMGSFVGRNTDYAGVLIVVLSIFTLLIILKRVIQFVIAEEMI